MNSEEKYLINFTILKCIGFYQLVNPSSPKMFGYNVYRVIHISMVVLTTTVTVIGLTGFVYNNDEFINTSFKDMQVLFYLACITVGNLKIFIVIYNADEIWKLFNIAHELFLSSKFCKMNYFKIKCCGEQAVRTLHCYLIIFCMTAILWILLPNIVNTDEAFTNKNNRKLNVVNLRYPVTTETYNTYYNRFYVLEVILCSYCTFGLVLFDIFLFVMLQLISTEYDIVSSAYENNIRVFHDENEDENMFSIKRIEDEFLSITSDCQNIYKNLKTICRISRPIVLIYMAGDSLGMITMPYLITMCYVSNETSSIFNYDIFTFLWTYCNVALQLYVFCSFFQLVQEKKESVTFGLYGCDWTSMDIKFKKRILLAMQIHSAINNNLMSVSPTKSIDLHMLAAIVRTSYNITSVMINTYIHKLKEY